MNTRSESKHGPIDLDDASTWPKSLDPLLVYLTELRAGPVNDLLSRIRRLEPDIDVLGWHCTRLRETEIDDVRLNGLRPLSLDFTTKRIDAARSCGELTREVAVRLKRAARDRSTASRFSLSNEPDRVGYVFFVVTREAYRGNEHARWYVKYWGGELISRDDRDQALAATLTRIGVPCIVELSVPMTAIELSAQSTRVALGPKRVLRVIRGGDPDFAKITGCESWPAGCTEEPEL
jgi:hypothetical protein